LRLLDREQLAHGPYVIRAQTGTVWRSR
jgi:hypothetical protein